MKKTGPFLEGSEQQIAAQFPSIEKLLASEDFTPVNKSFSAIYKALETVSRGRGGMGKTAEARKAMKAIERVMDLLRDLLKLKYDMPANAGDSSPHRK